MNWLNNLWWLLPVAFWSFLGWWSLNKRIKIAVKTVTTCPFCTKTHRVREERSFLDGARLTCFEQRLFHDGPKCPDCGVKNLLAGPCGGLSQNVYCGNEECGSRFNEMGVFGIDRITNAQPKKRHESPRKDYR